VIFVIFMIFIYGTWATLAGEFKVGEQVAPKHIPGGRYGAIDMPPFLLGVVVASFDSPPSHRDKSMPNRRNICHTRLPPCSASVTSRLCPPLTSASTQNMCKLEMIVGGRTIFELELYQVFKGVRCS
jgi:hypothetical protein